MAEQMLAGNKKIRNILLAALGAALLAAVAGFSYWFFACPCERLPGGYLLGEEVEQPVSDWTFTNQVELCQIQIRAGILPHSINLNCMATSTGELYLSCSACDGKYWSAAVQEDGRARIRLNGMVYPVSITRVQDAAEMDRAWQARIQKLQMVGGSGTTPAPADTPRAEGWWTFRVVSL